MASQNGRRRQFLLVHGSDGSLHCLGKTPEARTAHAKENNARIAQWFIEETVSPTGEHVCYTYQKEDEKDGHATIDTARTLGALCYLVQVHYGNLAPAKHLYAWDDAETPDWLFSLVFDYGERSSDPKVVPPMHANSYWLMRKDPFSGYHFGYETRCLRLCRQVLMYHHFPDELGEADTLVQRLILEYNENALLTQLRGVHAWAYGEDDSAMMQPPLDLSYTAFSGEDIDAASWQSWTGLPGLNTGHPFQLVDLYGEGSSGVLYQGEQGWHYREPVRGDNGDDISYAPWQSVPQLPSMQNQGQLLDLNGNGKLDWVVAIPGLAGCFSLNPDKTWSAFTPFSALPNEFFHPQAQLADLIGDGLSDLTLIGPNSVRFYANQRTGFESPKDIKQADGITLPVAGRDAQTLVAFSDILAPAKHT
ncbi:hypothetical protein AT251_18965 [Enterovibrio nigricans]|nr:hypothetical protein AT251_18965 [Enterovibrio nigricans]